VDLVLEVIVQEVGEGHDVRGLEVTAADPGHGLPQGGVLLGHAEERRGSRAQDLGQGGIERLLLDLRVLLFRRRDRLHHGGQDRVGRLQLDQAAQNAELLQEDAMLDLQAIGDLHFDLAMNGPSSKEGATREPRSTACDSSVGAQSFRGVSTDAHSFPAKAP